MFQKHSKTIKNIKRLNRILRLTILSIFVNFRRFLTNFDEHECKNIKLFNKIFLIDFDVFEKSISNLSINSILNYQNNRFDFINEKKK